MNAAKKIMLAVALLTSIVGLSNSSADAKKMAKAQPKLEHVCISTSRGAWDNCCHTYIAHFGKSPWLLQNGGTCDAAYCVASGSSSFSCSTTLSTTSHPTPPPPPPPKIGANGGPNIQSDMRLKKDIIRVGTTVYGLPLYDFQYIKYVNQPGLFEGVMAQDVLKVMPAAVITGADGFYRVNYTMLGIEMKRLQ